VFLKEGLVINTTPVHLQINDLKEKWGYVTLDFAWEMIKSTGKKENVVNILPIASNEFKSEN